jgi:DNA-binding XRE family transcriptional regulator
MPLFRTRLRVLRAEREWSQAKLAAQVGVTRQTINCIEKNLNSIASSSLLERRFRDVKYRCRFGLISVLRTGSSYPKPTGSLWLVSPSSSRRSRLRALCTCNK